jgi:hypothetical protein
MIADLDIRIAQLRTCPEGTFGRMMVEAYDQVVEEDGREVADAELTHVLETMDAHVRTALDRWLAS